MIVSLRKIQITMNWLKYASVLNDGTPLFAPVNNYLQETWMRLVFYNLMSSWFHNHLCLNPYHCRGNYFLNGTQPLCVCKTPGLAMLEVEVVPIHLLFFIAFHSTVWAVLFWCLKYNLFKIKCNWILWSASWRESFFVKWMCINNRYYNEVPTLSKYPKRVTVL